MGRSYFKNKPFHFSRRNFLYCKLSILHMSVCLCMTSAKNFRDESKNISHKLSENTHSNYINFVCIFRMVFLTPARRLQQIILKSAVQPDTHFTVRDYL